VTFIALNGKIIRLEKAAPGAVQRAVSGGDLTATMPGQVAQIPVEAGQQVTTGQTLLLLEAMKMETRITAPCDGIVRGFYARSARRFRGAGAGGGCGGWGLTTFCHNPSCWYFHQAYHLGSAKNRDALDR
jgi:hypothetical protein